MQKCKLYNMHKQTRKAGNNIRNVRPAIGIPGLTAAMQRKLWTRHKVERKRSSQKPITELEYERRSTKIQQGYEHSSVKAAVNCRHTTWHLNTPKSIWKQPTNEHQNSRAQKYCNQRSGKDNHSRVEEVQQNTPSKAHQWPIVLAQKYWNTTEV